MDTILEREELDKMDTILEDVFDFVPPLRWIKKTFELIDDASEGWRRRRRR